MTYEKRKVSCCGNEPYDYFDFYILDLPIDVNKWNFSIHAGMYTGQP